MTRRLFFPLVVLFWLTMNLLLWRIEMSSSTLRGSPVPVRLVWERILTAPDDSSLEVRHLGKKVGFCRWAPNVGEEVATGKVADEESDLEGRVKKLSGYTIDLDGNFPMAEVAQRLRFNSHIDFGANHQWRKFTVKFILRPSAWSVVADASAETVALQIESDKGLWEQKWTFAELADPQRLVLGLGMPLNIGWLGELMKGAGKPSTGRLALGLQWDARTDWMQVGHTRVRVYRLEARVLDKYRAVVLVSRVGEILSVELPNDVHLINEALALF